MEEKRGSIRVPVDFPVSIDVANEKTGATARNLSKDGMFLTTSRPFSRGTLILLQFSLPGKEKPMAVQAKVVWGMPTGNEAGPGFFGMGVHLENLKSTDSDSIAGYIDKLLA